MPEATLLEWQGAVHGHGCMRLLMPAAAGLHAVAARHIAMLLWHTGLTCCMAMAGSLMAWWQASTGGRQLQQAGAFITIPPHPMQGMGALEPRSVCSQILLIMGSRGAGGVWRSLPWPLPPVLSMYQGPAWGAGLLLACLAGGEVPGWARRGAADTPPLLLCCARSS